MRVIYSNKLSNTPPLAGLTLVSMEDECRRMRRRRTNEGGDAELPSGMSVSGVWCQRGLAAVPRAAREVAILALPNKIPRSISLGGGAIYAIYCAIYCAIKGVFARNNNAQ